MKAPDVPDAPDAMKAPDITDANAPDVLETPDAPAIHQMHRQHSSVLRLLPDNPCKWMCLRMRNPHLNWPKHASVQQDGSTKGFD
eukprot:257169-Pelagomonas_calceolata.AAC.1